MTVAAMPVTRSTADDDGERFRLHRAGILNVWQYDEQVFNIAGGRLILRGANGAGKSKTLEMLLPFALDGDKARITASTKHHTSLLWLMTDGLEAGNRIGYVWVEFARTTPDGELQTYTCGVGIRGSASARSATAWHFATDQRIGSELSLEDEGGPLSMPRLKEALGDEHVFEKSADYKAHVGRTLFGLDPAQYDEVLRLLYWLRQPQIGEDIEPAKLATQLSHALPQLDEQSVRTAGDTFEELTAFGEQIERRSAAATALEVLAAAYAGYARSVIGERARTVTQELQRERSLRSGVSDADAVTQRTLADRREAEESQETARSGIAADDARLRVLQDSPEFRDQRRLGELDERAARDTTLAQDAATRHTRQAEIVQTGETTTERRHSQVHRGLSEHVSGLHDIDTDLRAVLPGGGLTISQMPSVAAPDDVSQRSTIDAILDRAKSSLDAAASAVTRRLAAVGAVREVLQKLDRERRVQAQAEREAVAAEVRWEDARRSRIESQELATEQESALTLALDAWAAAPGAPQVDLPDELTDDVVAALPAFAQTAADPQLTLLVEQRARWIATKDQATAEITSLRTQRAAVVDQRDPAPAPPTLPRTTRPDGHALWQVLDFAEGLDAQVGARIEAALQVSGLLDAWVRPGGRLLGAGDLDVVLAADTRAGEAPAGGDQPTLARYLVPDLPPGSAVSSDDVRRVLDSITTLPEPAGSAWIDVDGRWRLGVAHGRASKEQAQFIGATARAGERSRRLAVLDAEIARQQDRAQAAERERVALDDAIAGMRAWVGRVPSGQPLIRSRSQLQVRSEVEATQESANSVAQQAARAARQAAADARRELERVATAQQLPADAQRLDAVEQGLRAVTEQLRQAERGIPSLRVTITYWAESVGELEAARGRLQADRAAAESAESAAAMSRAQFEELRASVGDSVEQLQRKISDVRSALERGRVEERAAADRLKGLIRAEGEADASLRGAQSALLEQLDVRAGAFASLAALTAVPGLLHSAAVDHADGAMIAALGDHPATEPVARAQRASVDRLGTVSTDEASATSIRVWRTYGDAATGPAGDHLPVVSEFGDLLAVSGRDEAGEASIGTLAERVGSAVRRDRDLLTDREKQQFEQHVLGELGDAIRSCRRDAEELVVAMNAQLGHVTTSQGIRVKLDWKLRDDVPPEVRSAVLLLAQPVGALIPEEREQLRDVLHRLIEASRVQRPELSYSEHLGAALDYRTWSEFTIRYTRPEKPGHWDRLHRRSPLSQGEQKVLCYLPLFAAAAAHFTSLAGAAPHAPRLVLLDDAFPKIDVRTHPLLFGLLVQLDLDFVITSERLWGDHATVPSLAIYEALRDPNQRGIAQYEYRWDGRILQGLG